MIRRLSIAASIAISALTLSGCVSDYAYRDGPGDYYYGRPSVDYNYSGYGAPYGSVGYGSGYYGGIGYGSGYYGGYGYPYGYGGNTYVYPRYYGGGYYDRDHGGHGRPDGNNGPRTPNYNRNVRGSDKIPGILERNRPSSGNGRDPGQLRYRMPDPQGQRPSMASPQGIRAPSQGAMGSRDGSQGRPQRSFQGQPARPPQQLRSAPMQRSAPPAASSSVQRGRDRGRISEP